MWSAPAAQVCTWPASGKCSCDSNILKPDESLGRPLGCIPWKTSLCHITTGWLAASREQKKQPAGVSELPEERDVGAGKIRCGGYSYCWSDCARGEDFKESMVQSLVTWPLSLISYLLVDKKIILTKLKRGLPFFSLVAVASPLRLTKQKNRLLLLTLSLILYKTTAFLGITLLLRTLLVVPLSLKDISVF